MISSASPTDRTPLPDRVNNAGVPADRPLTPRPDQISTESATFLRAALDRQPEIRSEVLARGRLLAADPGYPSAAVLRQVATAIIATPDLSDDES